MHNLSRAVAASHHVGVIHRDIKPSNILITGGFSVETIHITDFGISKMAEEELAEAVDGGESSITGSKTMVGALPYMAPEMIENPRLAGFPSDIWAIGALMFELLTGSKPFGAGLKAVKNILNGIIPQLPQHIYRKSQFRPLEKELLDIITKCLSLDPSTRPSCDDLQNFCDQLCYSDAKRNSGYVNNTAYNHGFITADDDTHYFFHNDSVYGKIPELWDRVCFSSFKGGGADRAHPVLCLKAIDEGATP